MEQVYRHPNIMMCRRRVADWIETIFDYYASQPDRLSERYGAIIQQEGVRRAAADYVADQTDRSIRLELLRLNPRQVGHYRNNVRNDELPPSERQCRR